MPPQWPQAMICGVRYAISTPMYRALRSRLFLDCFLRSIKRTMNLLSKSWTS